MDLHFGVPDYTPEQVPNRMENFVFDQYHLVGTNQCIKFMDALYDHDYEMDYHYTHDRESATQEQIAAAGLALMFNTGWLKEPAFVDWKQMSYVVYMNDEYNYLYNVFFLDKFLEEIDDPKLKIAIIKHLRKFYYPRNNRDLNLLLVREEIASKTVKEEKKKTPKISIGSQTINIGCTINNAQQTAQPSQSSDDISSGTPESDSGSSSSAPNNSEKQLFSRITKAAYDKGIAQQIEDELRSAAVSAPKLVKCIRTNEALGYLDTQNLNSTELYYLLHQHFNLSFKVRTFQIYRAK
ncbi:MAG: hypothetical protein J5884_00620 [Paludibacteraceae bacterium]|nr:hypothetical protein [Paludibacteraceae bacterium]